jgi:inosine/xanthosine triphosphate pyrophosphatase family protein
MKQAALHEEPTYEEKSVTTFVCTGNAGKIQEFEAYFEENTELVGIRQLESESGLAFAEPVEDFNYFLCNAFLKLTSSLRYYAEMAMRGSTSQQIKRILVDDSGLCVPRLAFEPGVHSAVYGGQPRSAERNRLRLRNEIAKCHGFSDLSTLTTEKRIDGFFVCFLLSVDVTTSLLTEVTRTGFATRGFSPNALEQWEKEVFQRVEKEILSSNAEPGGALHKKIPWRALFPNSWIEDSFDIDFGYCIGEVSTVEQTRLSGTGHGYDNMFYARQHPELSFASIPLKQKNAESHRALAMQSLAGRVKRSHS